MAIAQSRLTSQNQISVPAEIRKRLGIGPGSSIEWDDRGGSIVVRATKKYTSEEIRKILFPEGPPKRRSLKQMKKGVEQYFREQHARGRY